MPSPTSTDSDYTKKSYYITKNKSEKSWIIALQPMQKTQTDLYLFICTSSHPSIPVFL